MTRKVSRDEAAELFGEVVHRWPDHLEVVVWCDQLVVQDAAGREYGYTPREGRERGQYFALVPAGPNVSSRYMQSKHLPSAPDDPIEAVRLASADIENPLAGVLADIGGVWSENPKRVSQTPPYGHDSRNAQHAASDHDEDLDGLGSLHAQRTDGF
ncbi:hypothetical protein NQK81_14200 [Amycolatopsis roodepoortensis]|uniref:hypothetical protein n=1 Tax=Amycolatopsis roodepoortensis TaxID=700274 RepID=UPI00214BFFC1|nr:hypothetical protein [Amycolatopsis roodepoortensis]UUV34545.1 hypothetical protein NQK81_14200 [Amycolatopsis roodepoortensis]